MKFRPCRQGLLKAGKLDTSGWASGADELTHLTYIENRCYKIRRSDLWKRVTSTAEFLASMTREEIAQIIDPAQFTPFVVVTGSGSRFPVNHPDFVDLPPMPEEQDAAIPSFVVVYNRNGIPRLITLANIQEIEYGPGS